MYSPCRKVPEEHRIPSPDTSIPFSNLLKRDKPNSSAGRESSSRPLPNKRNMSARSAHSDRQKDAPNQPREPVFFPAEYVWPLSWAHLPITSLLPMSGLLRLQGFPESGITLRRMLCCVVVWCLVVGWNSRQGMALDTVRQDLTRGLTHEMGTAGSRRCLRIRRFFAQAPA